MEENVRRYIGAALELISLFSSLFKPETRSSYSLVVMPPPLLHTAGTSPLSYLSVFKPK